MVAGTWRVSQFDKNRFATCKEDWETPPALFQALHKEFQFTCDVAADNRNAKVPNFINQEQDALSVPWHGTCWLNPPYGRQLKLWVEKAYRESINGATIVMLIPSRTNTNWWHDFCMRASEIRFIKGRPKFVGAKHGLPQPLAIIIFKPDDRVLPKFSSYYLT